MAAAPGLLFWLLLLGPPWRVRGHPEPDTNRRFSELKLCADEQCSSECPRAAAAPGLRGAGAWQPARRPGALQAGAGVSPGSLRGALRLCGRPGQLALPAGGCTSHLLRAFYFVHC